MSRRRPAPTSRSCPERSARPPFVAARPRRVAPTRSRPGRLRLGPAAQRNVPPNGCGTMRRTSDAAATTTPIVSPPPRRPTALDTIDDPSGWGPWDRQAASLKVSTLPPRRSGRRAPPPSWPPRRQDGSRRRATARRACSPLTRRRTSPHNAVPLNRARHQKMPTGLGPAGRSRTGARPGVAESPRAERSWLHAVDRSAGW